MGSSWFGVVCIVLFSIWSLQAIISKIVDGVVKTKQSRMELERDYLAQMVADLEEIKAHLAEKEARQNAGL